MLHQAHTGQIYVSWGKCSKNSIKILFKNNKCKNCPWTAQRLYISIIYKTGVSETVYIIHSNIHATRRIILISVPGFRIRASFTRIRIRTSRKKPDPDPTYEKIWNIEFYPNLPNKIHILLFSFDKIVSIIDILKLYIHFVWNWTESGIIGHVWLPVLWIRIRFLRRVGYLDPV